jgi:type VII secretion-associated serine protease mycosin
MTTAKHRFAMLLCAATTVAASNPTQVDRIRDDQWHLRFLNVDGAHRYSAGDNIRVAVIDTGVDPHPDLQNNLLSGTDVVSRPGDGRVDDDSHGTSMAGLVAAHGSGARTGALGVAPKAKILPIRDGRASGQANSDALADGIEWAIEHDAGIISVASVGGPSGRLRNAIAAAAAADVVVVAAAGNRPSDLSVTFPAAYDGVLAVGATDRNGNHADFSVTGRQIAISAPGVDIYSTSIDGKYSKATGTSASTAIVSGAVALVRSKYPDLSAPEVVHRLTATATDKGPPGRDEQYGYGVLNLVAALTADVPPLGSATETPAPSTAAASAPPRGPAGGDDTRLWGAVLGALAAVGTAAVFVGMRRRRRQPPVA